MVFLKKVKRTIGRETGIRREASGIERLTVSENDILKIEFLQVNDLMLN